MASPYRIEGPALISFSGGRTSAFMLYQIVQAHGGTLPGDVHVVFANTGKEREETLRFVQECAEHWSVPVRWIELTYGRPWFREVTFETASRQGEPFEISIAKKQRLPSPARRFCTVDMKIKPMARFARSLGWRAWNNVLGLRYDEGVRVFKALARSDDPRERSRAVMPLAKAKVLQADVRAFWRRQNFDLGIESFEGNCDLCMLKSPGKLVALLRERPDLADWWIAQERKLGATFTGRESYEDLVRIAATQMPLFGGDDREHDAECGLHCE